MLLSEAIQLIRDGLGFNRSLQEDIILRHMNLKKGEREGESGSLPLPGFLFDPTWQTQTTLLTNIVTLPSNFISLSEMWELVIRDDVREDATGETDILERLRYGELQATGDPSRPSKFSYDGFNLYLFPLPDAVYRVQIPMYLRSDPFVSGTESHVWLDHFPSLIVNETLLSIGKSTRDSNAIKNAMEVLPDLRAAYLRRVEHGEHIQQQYTFGGDVE